MVGFHKQTVRDVPLEGKTVLVRVDYNVPLTPAGDIDDDLRIRASLTTIEYLLDHHCKVVLISHLGRPKGKEKKFSLEVVGKRLQELTGRDVHFVDDCIGDVAKQGVKQAPIGSIVLLENLRFYDEEEANDEKFAQALADASGARYFVQDGFGVVHRAHASTAAITYRIPSVAGFLLEKEVSTISSAMSHPQRPLVAVMGGAKVSDKITVIERFVEVADQIIIGGAMANTFFVYKGIDVGCSLAERDQKETLDAIYAAAAKKVGHSNVDEFILLPTDVAVGHETKPTEKRRNVSIHSIGKNDMVLDIGDRSIETMTEAIKDAKTVIWNGTLGYAELPEFAHGSARLALSLATQTDTQSIIGGGDTADFALKWDSAGGSSFSHVSTGGGASLELMAGEKLPGIECLLDKRK